MINSPEVKKNPVRWQKRVFRIMDSGMAQMFLMVMLMLSLFLADSWVAGNAPDSSNDILYGILTAIFVIFSIESIILSFVQDGYFLGFFFWMDILGTFSIILDIGWIADSFLPSGGIKAKGSILRATRAAKLGARYGRLMRLLKLMRFFRYLPCFSQGEVSAPEPTMTAVRRVSNQLSVVLSQRVAALVMTIVIVVPFLSYSWSDFSAPAWISAVKMSLSTNTTSYTTTDLDEYASSINYFYSRKDSHLYKFIVDAPWIVTDSYEQEYVTRRTLRKSNIIHYEDDYRPSSNFVGLNGVSYTTSNKFTVGIDLDVSYPNKMDAIYGILLILLVIFVLFGFSASFHNAVDKLVVAPLEKMMNTLRNSATIMLKSMKAMEEAEEDEAKKKIYEDDDENEEELETQMLEKMVDKLSRIVQHMMPGSAEMEIHENVDKATASWLSQNYSTTNQKVVNNNVVIDEVAEKQRLQDLMASQSVVKLEVLNSWDFDVLEFNHDQLREVISYVFSLLNIFNEFSVSMVVFQDFVREVESRYLQNTYHNFKHGCDVMHTVYRLLQTSFVSLVCSHLEVFGMLVAALTHDIGHPGVNNLYLVKAKHELAMIHNDRSPLENMHCAVLYEILSKQSTNIFASLNDKQWRDTRKLILTVILGTDMSHHFEQISKTQVFVEVNGTETKAFCSGERETLDCLGDEKNRLFVLELILHCADISNPYKPFAICAKWADLVVEEFCLQGDREKREGLEISPMMDRSTVNLVNMQLGFIEFVVAPLINSFIHVFPTLHEIGSNMANNFASWGERRKEDISRDDNIADKAEEMKKMDDRVAKFRDKMSFINDYRQAPKRRNSNNPRS